MTNRPLIHEDFWEERYQSSDTPWDLGEPAPPLLHYLERPDAVLQITGQWLVPGCGRGHDVNALAAWGGEYGLQATGMDFSPTAIDQARSLYGHHAHFLTADLFNLPHDLLGTFDGLFEHTLFCAIDPVLRPAYVEATLKLLKPNGKLLALFFCHKNPDGPPFKTDAEELKTLFSPYYHFRWMDIPLLSHPSRANQELLCFLERK